MVNIKTILRVGRGRGIIGFKTIYAYINWLAARETSSDKIEEWKYNYRTKGRNMEERVEELFDIEFGTLIGAHLIFLDDQELMEKFIAQKDVLDTVKDSDHVIVLEIRPDHCNIATFYSKDHQFSLVIDPEDLLASDDVEVRVGREARIPRLD